MNVSNLVVVFAFVTIDPDDSEMTGRLEDGSDNCAAVVADEVTANLESVSYVQHATVITAEIKEVKA